GSSGLTRGSMPEPVDASASPPPLQRPDTPPFMGEGDHAKLGGGGVFRSPPYLRPEAFSEAVSASAPSAAFSGTSPAPQGRIRGAALSPPSPAAATSDR